MKTKWQVRLGAVVFGVTSALLIGSISTPAQEPAKPKVAEKKAPSPSRRVPPYFNKVGISPDQKEKVYAVRGKYYEKIATLKKQIDELQTQELDECEALLTDAQRKLLKTFRDEAKPSRPDAKVGE